jgi:hypothetical protein
LPRSVTGGGGCEQCDIRRSGAAAPVTRILPNSFAGSRALCNLGTGRLRVLLQVWAAECPKDKKARSAIFALLNTKTYGGR